MATQGERVEALEKENGEIKATVAGLTDRLSDVERILKDGEAIAGELVTVEGFNSRDEVLAIHRKLEALANHLNFRLPA